MPILFMALVALGLFMLMGLLLFSAALVEYRQHKRIKPAATQAPPHTEEKPKARAAHA